MYIWALSHLLLFNESLLHYLSITCVTMMVFCVRMNDFVHLLYIIIYFYFGEATCYEHDSACGFLFYHFHFMVV